MSERSLVIVGAGGFGREAWTIAKACKDGSAFWEPFDLLGFLDDGSPDLAALERIGAPFLGPTTLLETLDAHYVIAIGDPGVRSRIDAQIEKTGRRAAILVHPSANIGDDVELSPGCVVAQNSDITTNVRIGRHTHLNAHTVVSHDCRVGDFVTLCPGVILCGAVDVGPRVFLGVRSSVLPGITVEQDSLVGGGAVVTRTVRAGKTVVGVPARELN